MLKWACFYIFSVQFSLSVVSDSLQPHESQHARPPCPSPTPGVHSDSCPSSQWCHPAISSSFIPFSSCPQSLPASESFPMSQLFTWGGQSTGRSPQHECKLAFQSVKFWLALTSVLSCFAFLTPVAVLPSEVPKLSPHPWGGFWVCRNFSFFTAASLRCRSLSHFLSLSLFFLFLSFFFFFFKHLLLYLIPLGLACLF